jgi:hypothetical protein
VEFEFEFEGTLIEWRGPAPFFFLPVPAEISLEIKELAKTLSYGWGVVPVKALIADTDFKTSLFPREGLFMVPIKEIVLRANQLEVGQQVSVKLVLGGR